MSQASDTPASSPSRAEGADLGWHLVVISGPSGAGKTTICRAVAERLALPISTSATTRPKRRGETDGVFYRSARNIEGLSVMPVAELSAYAVVRPRRVVFSREAFEKLLEQRR